MIYPTIYKRSVTGKVSTWYVETENNCFRTVSGFIDGQKVTSAWTCCEAKSYNTAEGQATAEAEAMHRKRLELGYWLDVNDIDKSVYFEPMLAKDWVKEKGKVKYPLFSQPKLDGIRCIVRSDGMWSRNGKQIISAPHIFEALKPLFEETPELILDGELYADKNVADFNTIISCVRKTKPTPEDLEISKQCIQYWVYDVPSVDGTFLEREAYLYGALALPDCCQKVMSTPVNNEAEVMAEYKKCIEYGYEGQILRLDLPYENKRSKALLKHKTFIDAEFTIIGVLEGLGNLSGKVGKLQFEIDGKPFESAVNGTWEYLEELYKRNDLIGKKATVKYFELTADGLPRFPKVIDIRDYE
jgi:DNA ligase-1